MLELFKAEDACIGWIAGPYIVDGVPLSEVCDMAVQRRQGELQWWQWYDNRVRLAKDLLPKLQNMLKAAAGGCLDRTVSSADPEFKLQMQINSSLGTDSSLGAEKVEDGRGG